jgi:hypothetical protein
VGTVANQSINGLPAEALVHGDPSAEHHLSYLPGQRLSRCTCEGEEHPGPVHADGTYVGRSAPEIDFFEAQVDLDTGGHVSLSAQWAVSIITFPSAVHIVDDAYNSHSMPNINGLIQPMLVRFFSCARITYNNSV